MMIRLGLGAFLLGFGSCTASMTPVFVGDGAAAVASAIDAAWQNHIAAAQAKDLARACELYADDVHYAVAGQPDLHGKPAIEAMERGGMQATRVVAATHSCLALRVDRNLAIAHELGTVQGQVAVSGEPPKDVTFHYLAAWNRGADGRWRIGRLVGHVVAPASPVP